jgi:hypothetical protein
MKTTIAITKDHRLAVYPNKVGGVTLETGIHNQPVLLTLDQVGALIFGLEQAAEVLEISQQRNDAVADVAAL